MSLIKDGTIYRTIEEQVRHLTNAHESQLTINSNISNRLASLEANTALGGYNYVRFAFERSGTYYYIATTKFTVETAGAVGNYVEISSYNKLDIPAYGYYVDTTTIELTFTGDFVGQYETLTIKNVTQNSSFTFTPTYSAFSGTYLLQYNPNDKKKQLFTVLTDLAYNNNSTKYASFDFNNDGIYNYVFIGLNDVGSNGYNVYTVTNDNVYTVISVMNIGDNLIWTENNQTSYVDTSAVIGDVYTMTATNTFEKKGNIRGEKGETGAKGEQGEQGVQGVQGIQGIQGEKGEKGDTGEAGASGLIINTGIKSSASDLPAFADTVEGDAYVVLNSSGTTITYDLYYHAKDGTDWDILSNWGGVKGDKGDKGDTGETGAQGVQGEQGEAGTAATITVGTVTTGEAGSSASVTNSGTENAAVLDFVIPKGDTGAQGESANQATYYNHYVYAIFINSSTSQNVRVYFNFIDRNSSEEVTDFTELYNKIIAIGTYNSSSKNTRAISVTGTLFSSSNYFNVISMYVSTSSSALVFQYIDNSSTAFTLKTLQLSSSSVTYNIYETVTEI